MAEQWSSAETRRLLNPIFTAAVLTRAVEGYNEIAGDGIPLAYCYLVSPLVLHTQTREALPASLATRLLPWTERSGEIVAALPRRAKELAPYSSKGIFAAITGGLMRLRSDAKLMSQDTAKLKAYAGRSGSDEVEAILKKSNFVGKWLAAAGTPATVFTALGVKLEDNSA
jgi:hypothetical protein